MPNQPQWTLTETARFWSYWAKRPDLHEEYFSYQVGRSVAAVAERLGVLSGTVLDYGCGPGFLIDHLLDRDLAVHGFEFSETYAEVVAQRTAGHRGWQGLRTAESLPTPYADGQFDLVFCLETMEHLVDDLMTPVLRELYRLCRPGGSVFITTPHQESLPENFIYCPFCDSEFHKVQHQRSFTTKSMRDLLTAHGFAVSFCAPLTLRRFQDAESLLPLRAFRPWRLRLWAGYRALRALDTMTGAGSGYESRAFQYLAQPGRNLVAIAQRPRQAP
jgi:SAM-dependent methyltransferase